jgi:hypothetical protein
MRPARIAPFLQILLLAGIAAAATPEQEIHEEVQKLFPTIFTKNWLRVLGTAELPHIDPGVRQQCPAAMSLLNARNTAEEPLACIRPRNGPVDASPQRLEGGLA